MGNGYYQGTGYPYQPGWGGWSNPYQYPQPSPQPKPVQQTVNNVIRVAGPESAKAFPMGPNSTAVLMDENNPVFYLKTTDDGGFASLRTFDFEERADAMDEPSGSSAGTYATKEDVEALNSKLDGLLSLVEGLV